MTKKAKLKWRRVKGRERGGPFSVINLGFRADVEVGGLGEVSRCFDDIEAAKNACEAVVSKILKAVKP